MADGITTRRSVPPTSRDQYVEFIRSHRPQDDHHGGLQTSLLHFRRPLPQPPKLRLLAQTDKPQGLVPQLTSIRSPVSWQPGLSEDCERTHAINHRKRNVEDCSNMLDQQLAPRHRDSGNHPHAGRHRQQASASRRTVGSSGVEGDIQSRRSGGISCPRPMRKALNLGQDRRTTAARLGSSVIGQIVNTPPAAVCGDSRARQAPRAHDRRAIAQLRPRTRHRQDRNARLQRHPPSTREQR